MDATRREQLVEGNGMSITGIGEVANAVTSIVDKIWPDATQAQKDALQREMTQLQMQQAMAQMQADTNKAEAGNASMFVAGWRPFIGWVCGAGLAYQFMFEPLATWVAALANHPVVMPALDLSTLMTLLLGMLGLGGMRTMEKLNGIKSGH
jgi:hypothetical protein